MTTMSKMITKRQARFFQLMKKDVVQHLSFGLGVFIIVFCIFSIIAWQQGAMGRSSIIEAFNIPSKIDIYSKIFVETLFYNLILAIPVYFNFFLVFKGQFQQIFKIKLINEAQLKGWGFYLFLAASAFTAFIFGWSLTPGFDLVSRIVDPQWFVNSIVILLLILCTSGISFIKDSMERMRAVERRERIQAKRELNFIKKQIRPHFLFNTLANLQILAKQKSEALPDLMAQLSKLLRYLLYGTHEAFVPVEQEIDFIKSYIALEKLQLPSKTDFSLEITGDNTVGQVIAPMLLLTFIENCFKHYNKKERSEKFIRISIGIEANLLTLSTANTFKVNAQNEHNIAQKRYGGLGLKNARENLNLIYKDQYDLEVFSEGDVYFTKLKVTLHEKSF